MTIPRSLVGKMRRALVAQDLGLGFGFRVSGFGKLQGLVGVRGLGFGVSHFILEVALNH